MDPLAAAFSPFRQRLPFGQISQAYAAGCEDLNANQSCYPVLMYGGPEYHDLWEAMGLRPPATSVRMPTACKTSATTSPATRATSCMARRFTAYLTQTSLGDVPAEKVADLQQVLIDSDMNARALAVAVVTRSRLSGRVGRHRRGGTAHRAARSFGPNSSTEWWKTSRA